MKNKLLGSAGVAGVVYAIVSVIYGNAEYADFGPVQTSTETVQSLFPIIAAVLYPLVTSKWPWVKAVLDFFKYRPPAIHDLLGLLTRFEQHGIETGCDQTLETCQQMRRLLLKEAQAQKVPASKGKVAHEVSA